MTFHDIETAAVHALLGDKDVFSFLSKGILQLH